MWSNRVLLIAVITMTISQSNGYHENNQMTLGKHHRKGTGETGEGVPGGERLLRTDLQSEEGNPRVRISDSNPPSVLRPPPSPPPTLPHSEAMCVSS